MEKVVDANVFIHGKGSYPFTKALVIPEVLEEIQSQNARNILINTDYQVKTPSEKNVDKVKEKASEINSPTSEADEKLLALALEMDKNILTDDKALQNLALHLETGFEGFLDKATDQKFFWEKYCGNCGRKVSGSKCGSCGSTHLSKKQVRCSSE